MTGPQRVEALLDLAEEIGAELLREGGTSSYKFTRALNDARRALDYLPGDEAPYEPREAAGNMFRANDKPGLPCSQCGTYWPPAGREKCDRCDPLPPWDSASVTPEQRAQTTHVLKGIAQHMPQIMPIGEEP